MWRPHLFLAGASILASGLVVALSGRRRRPAVQGLALENAELQAQLAEYRRHQQETDCIFTLSLDMLCIMGFDGYLKRFNPACQRILGWSHEELQTQPYLKLVHPDDVEKTRLEIMKLAEGVNTILFEVRILCKDGSYRYVLWNSTPIAGTQCFYAAGRDITERKKVELALLEGQKMETVGRLAGGVAHEFNSIMTAIIGQSELLLADLPPRGPLARHAAEIRESADRAAVLTRQLLAFGRKQLLRPEVLNLNQIITSVEQLFPHLLGHNVNVQVVPGAGLKGVFADASQIQQAILNIVMNARDAMPNGGSLSLETSNVTVEADSVGRDLELKPGAYVMLAICDTGIGMSREVQSHLFEPFFSTKGPGAGAGLGLATAHGIIKQSGGTITVYSEPNEGTTFKLYLPQAQDAAPASLPKKQGFAQLPRGSETILFVEDDAGLRKMASSLLERLGYSVLVAANGQEALSLVEQPAHAPIDLLFTDLTMPHLGGEELSRCLLAKHPGTRVLFASGYTESSLQATNRLPPDAALLQKPFSPMTLAVKVRELLDR